MYVEREDNYCLVSNVTKFVVVGLAKILRIGFLWSN